MNPQVAERAASTVSPAATEAAQQKAPVAPNNDKRVMNSTLPLAPKKQNEERDNNDPSAQNSDSEVRKSKPRESAVAEQPDE